MISFLFRHCGIHLRAILGPFGAVFALFDHDCDVACSKLFGAGIWGPGFHFSLRLQSSWFSKSLWPIMPNLRCELGPLSFGWAGIEQTVDPVTRINVWELRWFGKRIWSNSKIL